MSREDNYDYDYDYVYVYDLFVPSHGYQAYWLSIAVNISSVFITTIGNMLGIVNGYGCFPSILSKVGSLS